MKRTRYSRYRIITAILFLLITTLCLMVGTNTARVWLSLQAGPAWASLVGQISLAGAVSSIVLLIATLVFGRFFCSILCPLGAFQDIVDHGRQNSVSISRNHRALRYSLAAFCLALLIGGWTGVFRLVEPFTRYSAFVGAVKEAGTSVREFTLPANVSGFIFGGLVPLLTIAGLTLWRRRVYCVAACPVGTVLGIVAIFSKYRLRMNNSCTGCGICERKCPTGAIDSQSRTIDNERCVLCLSCLSACSRKGLVYGKILAPPKKAEDPAFATERRRFLVMGASIVGTLAVGAVGAQCIRRLAQAADNVTGLVLPPGAIGSDRFAHQCTGCMACAMSCPVKIIKPSPSGFGPVRLDYSRSGCLHECTVCNTVCPSGALKRLEIIDKQWLKIGEAVVDAPKCRVLDGIECTLCANACPTGAIFMMDGPQGLQLPEVAAFHCIGCGACQAICPMQPKAITVTALEQSN